MSDPVLDGPAGTARRVFLGQLATAAVALAATACATGTGAVALAGPAPEPGLGGGAPTLPAAPALPKLEFDDAWTNRLAGEYRAVFDSPEVEDGTALFNAYAYRKEFKDMYKLGDADVNAVIVVRHRAIPMILDDTIWARYKLGESTKVKDPATGTWAVRNPFWKADARNKEYGDLALETMVAQGVVVLGCALATEGVAGMIASRTGDRADAMFDELRRHLLPTVVLQPSGIFAVMRAQVAGCHYMRST